MRYNSYKKFQLKTKEKGLINLAGRNNFGKITVRHKGKGHKKKFRQVNFFRQNSFTGVTCSVLYDPNRNSNIASIYDFFNNKSLYILAPKNLKVGDILKTNNAVEPKLGYSLPLNQIPVGSYLHNISIKNSGFAKMSWAAGAFSKLKQKTLYYAHIELNSGKVMSLSTKCYATIGIVSNELFFLWKLKKAGQIWWANKRPTVRGVAMNPIDHPNGGGEGKKSGINKTPWSKIN